MAPTKRRIMRSFKLREISAVDKPAQAGALMSIMKGKFPMVRVSVVKDSPKKTDGGKEYSSSDYAYVPDPSEPSTWKLRLTSTPGGGPDPKIVGAAAAALGAGFRGRKVQIPSGDRAKVVARVRAAWNKANPDKTADDAPPALQKAFDTEPTELVASIMKYYGGYIDPANGAIGFADVLDTYEQNEEYQEMMRVTSPLVSALDTSLRSVIADQSLDAVSKNNLMRSAVEEFLAAMKAKWPDVEQELTKSLALTMSGSDNDEAEEWTDMASISDMKKQITLLAKQVEEASAPAEKAAALELENADLKKKIEDIEKVAAAEKAKKVDPEVNPKDDPTDMPQAHQDYHDSLDAAGKKRFMGMGATARGKEVKDKMTKNDDETIVVAGQTISKSASGVNDAMWAVMKAQASEVATLKADKDELAKSFLASEEKAELMVFAKQAEETMQHLPGTIDEKANVLKSIAAMPEAQRVAMEKMLSAGDKAVSAAYKTIGSKGGVDISKNGGADSNTFTKRVAEVKKRDGLSETAAMSKARKEYPEEFAAYQEAEQAN